MAPIFSDALKPIGAGAMSKLHKHRRIVAVQGAVQLVSAMAAMRISDRRFRDSDIENHLIVHDLSAPGDQPERFATCLHELAKQAGAWSSMRFLPLPEMLRFQAALKNGGWDEAIKTFHQTVSFDYCDELMLGQNLLFINNLMNRSYPAAETACYGDGIGLNFSADYYRPEPDNRPGFRAIERWIRKQIRTRRGKDVPEASAPMKSNKHVVQFNKHYLLLANHFDQQLKNYEQMNASDFTQLFGLFADSLPQFAEQTCRKLNSELEKAEQVIVLLTSNFSETKRMTLDGEVACCMELVLRQQLTKTALLIIKPHPRDSQEKILAIEGAARKSFRSVVTLADPWTFFVPFESIYDRFFASNPRIQRMTSVVCSSSACVSLEMLYGQKCELGFGARNVRRHFALKWQELRVRHELDLNHLLKRIRKAATHRVAV